MTIIRWSPMIKELKCQKIAAVPDCHCIGQGTERKL